MNAQAWMQLVAYLAVLLVLAWPLGRWLVAVAEGRLPRWMAPFTAAERGLYRLALLAGLAAYGISAHAAP